MEPATRRALIVTLASLLLCIGWELRPIGTGLGGHPFGDLSNGKYTDHFSHVSCARLFPRIGLDLWRHPLRELFPTLEIDAAAGSALPADLHPSMVRRNGHSDVFAIPGWPRDKPAVVSWAHNPRLYPPGDLLLVAPAALLYHFTPISFSRANRLTLLLLLLYAHVAAFFYWLGAFSPRPGNRLIRLAIATLAHGFIVYWALEGFYDSAAIAPLALCSILLAQRRGVEAILAFCAAAAIHFRALFLAPWALYGAWLIVRERQWRSWRTRHRLMVLGVALLALFCLGPFYLVWPTLRTLPIGNPVHLATAGDHPLAMIAFLLTVATAAGTLWWSQARLDLAVLVWMSLMLLTLRQACPWHVLGLMAWMAAPVAGAAVPRASAVHLTRVGFLLVSTLLVFLYNSY